MNPREFIDSIYLGDRFCKSILIDGFTQTVKIQINVISRRRNMSGEWQYYKDENIIDGLIVFTGVETVSIEPKGIVPNDEIEFIDVKIIDCDINKFSFELSVASCNKQGETSYGTIMIISERIHLEDPRNPGVKILE